MNPQLTLFEQRPDLGIRGRAAYQTILNALIEARTGGRLLAAGRWRRTRWEAMGLQRSSVRSLEKANIVRWEGDDLVWVGWDETRWGQREAFARLRARWGAQGARARWGARGDRLGDRLADRHLIDKPAPLPERRAGSPHGIGHGPRAPAPEIPDLRSGSGVRDPFEQSSSGRGASPPEDRDRVAPGPHRPVNRAATGPAHESGRPPEIVRPAPAAPPARLAARTAQSSIHVRPAAARPEPRSRPATDDPEPSWRRGWQQEFPGEPYPGRREAMRRITAKLAEHHQPHYAPGGGP